MLVFTFKTECSKLTPAMAGTPTTLPTLRLLYICDYEILSL
jgi:hypothetical protein